MKIALKFVYSLVILVSSASAWAGAVSAGGMQAPAKVECLFPDPEKKFEPYNLIVFDFRSTKNPASLQKVDLVSKELSANHDFVNLATDSRDGILVYSGSHEVPELQLFVAIKDTKPLQYDQYIKALQAFVGIKDVTFIEKAIGYRSALWVAGRKYEGICAKENLFHYLKNN